MFCIQCYICTTDQQNRSYYAVKYTSYLRYFIILNLFIITWTSNPKIIIVVTMLIFFNNLFCIFCTRLHQVMRKIAHSRKFASNRPQNTGRTGSWLKKSKRNLQSCVSVCMGPRYFYMLWYENSSHRGYRVHREETGRSFFICYDMRIPLKEGIEYIEMGQVALRIVPRIVHSFKNFCIKKKWNDAKQEEIFASNTN